MKKWLFVLSIVMLSNWLRGMEAEHEDNDWDNVNDSPTQLVKELVENADITKNWEDIDPMGQRMDGTFTIVDNYPDAQPAMPIQIPLKSPKSKNPTLAASLAASSLSTTHASYASTQSHISYGSSGFEKIKKLPSDCSPEAALLATITTMKKSSPVAASHTIATSLLHMSSSSIETSIYEDRGVNLHYDDEIKQYDLDDEQKKRAKSQSKKQKPTKPEDLSLADFFGLVFAHMIRLEADE